MSNSLGKRIRRMMQATGKTQVQLAEAAVVTQGYMSHLLSGRRKMVSADIIFRLADALECDAKWLATGEHSETEEEA